MLAAAVGDGTEGPSGTIVGNIWTSTSQVTPEWTGMCCAADGIKFAACNSGYIFTSEDSGATLVERKAGSWRAIACNSDRTKLVAVIGWQANTGNIWLSIDSGANWTDVNVTATTPPPANQHWRSVAMNGDGTVIVAAVGGDPGDTAKTGSIWLSVDSGATWNLQTTPGVKNWQTLSSNADGTRLAAAVSDGAEAPAALGSVLGDIWTSDTTDIPAVAAIPGRSCASTPPYPTACIKPPRNTF